MDKQVEDLLKRLTRLERIVADLPKKEVGRWMDWTPTVTQSGSVTVTVTFARYKLDGDTVQMEALLGVTGSGTTNNDIIIGNLPFNIKNFGDYARPKGVGSIFDSGTGVYRLIVNGTTTSTLKFLLASASTTTYAGNNPSFGLANGDFIGFSAVYERA